MSFFSIIVSLDASDSQMKSNDIHSIPSIPLFYQLFHLILSQK